MQKQEDKCSMLLKCLEKITSSGLFSIMGNDSDSSHSYIGMKWSLKGYF